MTKSPEYDNWLKTLGFDLDKVETVGSFHAEQSTLVVCRLATDPLLMPDNLTTPCIKCFRIVQFRPTAPKTPPKMCDECARKEIESTKDEVRFTVTEKTLGDLIRHAVRKKMN